MDTNQGWNPFLNWINEDACWEISVGNQLIFDPFACPWKWLWFLYWTFSLYTLSTLSVWKFNIDFGNFWPVSIFTPKIHDLKVEFLNKKICFASVCTWLFWVKWSFWDEIREGIAHRRTSPQVIQNLVLKGEMKVWRMRQREGEEWILGSILPFLAPQAAVSHISKILRWMNDAPKSFLSSHFYVPYCIGKLTWIMNRNLAYREKICANLQPKCTELDNISSTWKWACQYFFTTGARDNFKKSWCLFFVNFNFRAKNKLQWISITYVDLQ